jgi:probable phosphoglycerate mutase
VRLLLIRHGQTPSNVAAILDTAHPGPGLTELGVRQAAEIPRALAAEPVDRLFVSTLHRTQLTAAPLASNLGVEPIVLPGIHEIEAGELEKRGDREAVATYLKTAFAWGLGDLDARMPGASNGHAFFDRYDTDIRAIEREVGSGTAVVVSHGAAIRVWVAGRATNVPPMFAGEHDIANTGIVELDGTLDTGFTLLSWQGSPVGGPDLDSPDDPAGETLSDAGVNPRD